MFINFFPMTKNSIYVFPNTFKAIKTSLFVRAMSMNVSCLTRAFFTLVAFMNFNNARSIHQPILDQKLLKMLVKIATDIKDGCLSVKQNFFTVPNYTDEELLIKLQEIVNVMLEPEDFDDYWVFYGRLLDKFEDLMRENTPEACEYIGKLENDPTYLKPDFEDLRKRLDDNQYIASLNTYEYIDHARNSNLNNNCDGNFDVIFAILVKKAILAI